MESRVRYLESIMGRRGRNVGGTCEVGGCLSPRQLGVRRAATDLMTSGSPTSVLEKAEMQKTKFRKL